MSTGNQLLRDIATGGESGSRGHVICGGNPPTSTHQGCYFFQEAWLWELMCGPGKQAKHSWQCLWRGRYKVEKRLSELLFG